MDFLTKLEMIDGLSIVTDNNVAVEILKSDAFSVVNIVDHLKRLQENTGVSLENLIKFASYSPFFNEGDKHQELKKIFSDVLGKTNVDLWLKEIEKNIDATNQDFNKGNDLDLMDYSFSLVKRILSPMIFGTENTLPDDFEKRLYHFQKIAEPLLSVRELFKLEDEIKYLFSCVSKCIEDSDEYMENSLFSYLNKKEGDAFSEQHKIMLLIIVYGTKTPLIQTLGNIFLEILTNKKKDYFHQGFFDNDYFNNQLDSILHKSASLLHIHRVAIRDFKHGEFSVKKGEFVLIQIGSGSSHECSHYKSLSFGLRTHYCSGAFLSKVIISMVIPAFFKMYPNVTARSWGYDSAIHTAKTLTKFKVTIE